VNRSLPEPIMQIAPNKSNADTGHTTAPLLEEAKG
jgi:hypothetical protein